MTERRMRLLAGLLAVCTVAASVTGCMKPNRMGAAGGGENSGPAPVKVEIMAQAEYPQEPVYKNDEERYEARYAREIPERFEEAYGSFAFRTAAQVLGKGSQVNQIYSPLGLYYALAMSAQGAAGETRQELMSLLGYPEGSGVEPDSSRPEGFEPGSSRPEGFEPDSSRPEGFEPDSSGPAGYGTAGSGTELEQLAQDCQTAFQALYHVPNPANAKKNEWGEMPEDSLYSLRIANSLWADQALEMKEEFADQAAGYFYSDIFRTDLHGPGVAQAMADWVKDRTGGVIVPGTEPVPEEELLSLRNTVYYYDEWIDRFNKDQTEADVFTTADKTQVTCEFMNRTMGSHGFRRGENFTSSSLSLKNGSMEFVLPDEGVDVRELVKSPEILKEVLEGTDGNGMGEVVWKIPKFTYGSSRKLTENLKELGVRKAFGAEADFPGISDYKPLGISGVSQDAHIAIDENGVEAAAFTEIAYAGAAPPDGRADMILNRPFLYVIRSRGQILFMGICGNPQLEEEPEGKTEESPGEGPEGNPAEVPGEEPEGNLVEASRNVPGNHPSEALVPPEKSRETGRSSVTPEDLLAAWNPSIGDASADGRLLELVWDYYGLAAGRTMELQTADIPYGMTLHLDQEPDNITMQKAAGLLMGLIDNCYSVSWDYPSDEMGNRAYFYMPVSAFRQYGNIPYIKEYVGEDEQLDKMNDLLEILEHVDQPLSEKTRARTLDEAVAAAVLEYNRYGYATLDCEAFGEGHKLLGQEETDTTATVYALAMYGAYQFQDGNLVKGGGTGVIPVVIRMVREPDGAYVAVRYQKPEDGGGYIESIQKMFPRKLWDVCISPPARDREDIKQQEQAYGESCLRQLGRKAVVGDYGDFPHTLLTDVGVPVEVSNALGDIREFAPEDPARFAPYWLGNVERLEDGVRYLYEQSYDGEKKEILFSKIRYETGETVEQSVYDGLTGKKKRPPDGLREGA
ncbi:MAG: DUF4825 domain-containing protein [Lachnospiraceae bacterium]|nr:DUF4825 domain-containing protein [Lachnospiraceae bacterium]